MLENIYLTEEGFIEFQDNIKDLRYKLTIIQKEKSEACSGAVGDGWHDNFAYEDAKRNEDTVVTQINNLLKQQDNIEIIKKEKLPKDKVNLDDVIEIEFICDNGYKDIDIFKLTGNWKSKELDDYQEITLNSPLGKALYKIKLGSTTTYKVNDKEITIKVLRKI